MAAGAFWQVVVGSEDPAMVFLNPVSAGHGVNLGVAAISLHGLLRHLVPGEGQRFVRAFPLVDRFWERDGAPGQQQRKQRGFHGATRASTSLG